MGPIIYTREPPLAVIALNRPEKLNAIDDALYRAFEEALADFNSDASLRVAILMGVNERAFSAGADMRERLELDEYGNTPVRMGGDRRMLEPFSYKPLVAAVDGYCVGHGIDWAMHCDCIIATDRAVFGLPEVKVGVTAGFVWDNIPHMGRVGDGMKMLLAGDPIPAEDAHRLGLAQKIVPREALMAEARVLAMRLAALEPEAAAKIKRVAYFWRNLMLEEIGRVGFTFSDKLREQRGRMG